MCHKRKLEIFSCGANSMISMLIIYYAETLCLKLSPRLAPNADGVFMFIRIFTTVFRVNIAWTPFFRLEKFKFRTLAVKYFLRNDSLSAFLESVLISSWIFPESHSARVFSRCSMLFLSQFRKPPRRLEIEVFSAFNCYREKRTKRNCQAAPAKKNYQQKYVHKYFVRHHGSMRLYSIKHY